MRNSTLVRHYNEYVISKSPCNLEIVDKAEQLTDRFNWLMWPIYQAQAKGERVGKAIRKQYPDRHDMHIRGIASVISDQLVFKISRDKDDFIKAYKDVSSCEQGNGHLLAKYYPSQVCIATLTDRDGTVVARSLVNMDRMVYTSSYGWYNWAIKGVLALLGLESDTVLTHEEEASCKPVQFNYKHRISLYTNRDRQQQAFVKYYAGSCEPSYWAGVSRITDRKGVYRAYVD